jgi:hypothetical protein
VSDSTPPELDKLAEPEDQTPRAGEFYFEGPYMVFTQAYHLRRGYCCNSDCRHCPYR